MQPAGHVMETTWLDFVLTVTSLISADICDTGKLYRYFLLCLLLVTEDITIRHNTRTSINFTFKKILLMHNSNKCLTSKCLS